MNSSNSTPQPIPASTHHSQARTGPKESISSGPGEGAAGGNQTTEPRLLTEGPPQ
jgi:hypothetical protein